MDSFFKRTGQQVPTEMIRKGKDLRVAIEITFEESIYGCQKGVVL